MKTGLIIGISVLVLVVILVVFYFVHKSSSAVATASMAPSTTSAVAPAAPAAPAGCTPYSTDQQKRDIQKIRTKCEPKLIIPIVGVGAYTKCMGLAKSKLPPIC